MSLLYEIVIFTASQKLYADKVIDLIDPKHRISHRLYREHCVAINKTYYLKNIQTLGRKLKDVIIVDVKLISFRIIPSQDCFNLIISIK
jgi:CTD small phosphatase-like protein 2